MAVCLLANLKAALRAPRRPVVRLCAGRNPPGSRRITVVRYGAHIPARYPRRRRRIVAGARSIWVRSRVLARSSEFGPVAGVPTRGRSRTLLLRIRSPGSRGRSAPVDLEPCLAPNAVFESYSTARADVTPPRRHVLFRCAARACACPGCRN
jgi:hypothetical protein